MEGKDNCWLPREKFYYFCKLGNKIYFPKYYFYSNFDYVNMYGTIDKGRIVSFDILLENEFKEDLKFFISYMENVMEIFPSFNFKFYIPFLNDSYYTNEQYVLKQSNNTISIYKYDFNLVENFEENYCNQLKEQQKDHLIEFRRNKLEYRKEKNKNSHEKQIWLINDEKEQAGNNGEYFFRYLKLVKPEKILFYFILNKNCTDYERLKIYGNIIDLNSEEYLNLFLKADKIITSVSESWVNNAFGEDIKYMIDLYNFELIYLPKEVITDEFSLNLNGFSKKYDLIMMSSKKEYKFLLNLRYGYSPNNLAITGLPRFDNLFQLKNDLKNEKIIIIFPSFNSYIRDSSVIPKFIKSEDFINTSYYKFYNDLINDLKLLNIMEKNDYKGVFCLDQIFLEKEQYEYFNDSNIFKIKKNCNNQNLFVKASLLITDYSNIFFDFGYIEKPIIYIQFDYEEHKNNQFRKGNFDYNKDGFGSICYDIQCTIKLIINEIESKCKLKYFYKKRIKRFFKFHDVYNCYRTYVEIMKNHNKKILLEDSVRQMWFIISIFLILKIKINKSYDSFEIFKFI